MPTNLSKPLLLAAGLLLPGVLFATETIETFADLCQHGISHNPKVLSREHQTKASHYRYNQAVDQYKPQLSVTGNYGYDKYDYEYPSQTIHYNDTITQYSINLTQPIFRPVYWKKIKDAKMRRKVAALQEEDEKARLITQILQTSLDLIRLQQIRELTLKKVDLYTKAYNSILTKYKMHFSSNPELMQAKQKLMQAKSDLAQVDQLFKSRQKNLYLLVNSDRIAPSLYRQKFRVTVHNDLFSDSRLQEFRTKIEENTQMRLYRTYLAIADNDIGTRKYERYPTLDARVSYSDIDSTDSIQRNNESKAMLYLNFPLYQGGYVSDRVSEGIELKKAAEADLENSRLSSRVSVEKDWDDIQNGLATLKAQIAAEEAATAYFQSAVQAYKNGIGSLTDAYLAEADKHDASIAIVNTKSKILTALVDLYYYIGESNLANVKKFRETFLTPQP